MKTEYFSSPARARRFLVTGGNGYLGSWIVRILLAQGHHVHTTVRKLTDRSRYFHLLQEPGASERLTVFEAGLLRAEGYDAAVAGCDTVLHVASPFAIEGIKDAQRELVDPAVQGTRHLLSAVNRAHTVKRVVLTSSAAAIYGDAIDGRGKVAFSENDWNITSSLEHQPYAYSKTQAEREAWRIADAQSRWSLVVLNPGFILGPAVAPDASGVSQTIMRRFADGTFKRGMVNVWYGFVDVRDAAQAHVTAAVDSTASSRYIISGQSASLLEVASILRSSFGDRYPLPKREAKKAILWLVPQAFGFTRRYVSGNVGIPLALDNSRSRKGLGVSYRPLETTLLQHFSQVAESVPGRSDIVSNLLEVA